MKNYLVVFAASLAMIVAGSVFASTPDYTYVEGGYSHALHKNGATVGASLDVAGPLFATTQYNVLGKDFQQAQVGVGLHVEPVQAASLYAEAVGSFNKNRDESWRGNRTGYGAVGGVRVQVAPALELDASTGAQKLYGSQNQWTRTYGVGAVLNLTPRVAVFARGTRFTNLYFSGDRNANEWTGGMRLTF